MRKASSVITSLSIASLVLFGCGQTSTETVDAPVTNNAIVEDVEVVEAETETEAPAIDTSENAAVETEPIEEVEKVADTEDDLLAILSNACSDTILKIIRDDFDGDDVFEAFAVTSKDPYAEYFNDPDNAPDCYDDFTVWYVTHAEATAINDVPFGPNFVYMKSGVFADGTKAVIVDCFMSNVDTDSYIFTLKDGTYNYLGTHTSATIAEDGLLYSWHYIIDIETSYFEAEIYEYTDEELILKDTIREDV